MIIINHRERKKAPKNFYKQKEILFYILFIFAMGFAFKQTTTAQQKY